MINYKLEWILLMADNNKFTLKSGKDKKIITLPSDYLQVLDWENEEVEIANAWWSKSDKCYRIQIQLCEKPKENGKWAK